ncbi:MAG: tyrosine--tRNA ligase [Candidatus Omnitrophica bacterium]|nr:tyrosine--tRNA ligase [Candidatus Omnitrophota bacterium]
MMPVNEQLDIIKRGAEEIISLPELEEKLSEGRPLVIKAGFDPSAPDIHLGHTVLLRKMRHFQRLGHGVVFLIGDFTGRIGDPSGRSKTRVQLTPEQVKENAKTYEKQIFKILDKDRTEIAFNSKWCSKLGTEGIFDLSCRYTVARMLERDDFLNRYKKKEPITLLEFLYPLIQGYDSVVMKADVELGGTDQKFNLLVGRDIQRSYGLSPQVIITMPILEGLDGVDKMSKSLNNYVGINEPPDEMFGKIMSISDELMWRYFELLSFRPLSEIVQFKKDMAEGKNPRDIKFLLGEEIVARFHSQADANKARENFIARFQKGAMPDDMPEVILQAPTGKLAIANLLKEAGLTQTTSESLRMIKQGAVRIDGERIADKGLEITTGSGHVFQVGKRRFAKVVLN